MAGFGLGFGANSKSRQYAALGGSAPVTVLRPSSQWNGVAGSGFSGTAPQDPPRTTAKPVCRLLTPPNQFFTQELVVGVWAAANHDGSLLDDLGLARVIAHCEGNSFEIPTPSYYLFADANGTPRRYLGWWVVLQHPGVNGHAQVYFEAIPKDPAMQARVIGPYQFSPQAALHDYTLEVAASPAEQPGARYKTLAAALNYLTSVGAQNPLVTFTETYDGDLASANLYAGGQGYCTITANAPVTFRKPGLSLGASALFRPRVDGLWFKGANITFDFRHASVIYHESPANRQHVFDGVTITDSGGRYAPYLGGQKPTLYVARDRPYYLECTIEALPDACNNANLVRGCTLRNGNRDAASGAYCVIGNTIHDWSSDEWRAEIPSLSVQYTGAATSATLELTGANDTSGRVLTARTNGAIAGTFTILATEAAFSAGTQYSIGHVASWLNTLPGWSASVLDDSRRAAALSVAGARGGAFGPRDAKASALTLVTMFDQHSDLWALDASSDQNLIFVDNLCFDNVVQSLFVGPPSGLKDAMVLNNAFHLDPTSPDAAILASQLLAPCSHLVVAHNSWANQNLALRTDLTFAPDGYCLVANNVIPSLLWSGAAASLPMIDNHLFAGAIAPVGASGTTIGGTMGTLFADPPSGQFAPSGALLESPRVPVVRHDLSGLARANPAPLGALANGAAIGPAITSANPSASYAEGTAIGGVLSANKPVSWSVSGPQASLVTLDPVSGAWSLPPTDFETRNAYAFTFTATDIAAASATQTVAIAITDVDEVVPVLAVPGDAANGPTSASLSVTTTESGGTLYWFLSASAVAPNAAALKAGTGALASGAQAVVASGVQTVLVSGLAVGTGYFAHFLHRDGAGNDSAIVSGDGFSTPAASTVAIQQSAIALNTSQSLTTYAASPFTYVGGSNRALLAVVVATQNATQPITNLSATVNGAAMSRIAGLAHSSGVSRPILGVFAATGLGAGTKQVDVTITGGGRSCGIVLLEVSGVDAAALLANTTGLEGNDPGISHAYSPVASGNLILSAIATRHGDRGPFTPEAGMTELADFGSGTFAGSDHSCWVGWRIAPGTAAIAVGASAAQGAETLFAVAELKAA